MSRSIALAVAALFLFTLPAGVLGTGDGGRTPRAPTTYYVAPGGLDSNAGDQAHPFREIRTGLAAAAAGDTVLVADGSYLGFDVDGRHGSDGNSITIKAQGNNAVVTVTTDRPDNRDTIFISASSYIVIDGLRSFNANRAAMRIDQSDHISALNCTFGDNAVWGIFTDFSDDILVEGCELYGSGSQHGIYFSNSGDRPTARNNTIHDNYGCGIHMNGDASMGGDGIISGALIEGNVIYGNGAGGGGGINMDGVRDSVVQNNVLYGNHASGITNYIGDGASGPSGNVFFHNTVDMAPDARWALQITDTVGPVKVRNNILYDRNANRGGLALGDANDVANVESDYNIMDRVTPDGWSTIFTLAQWQAQGHEAHSLSASPSELFADDAAADYHLKAGSPAIDRGQTLAQVPFDKEGKPRPIGNSSDIGAYEWGAPQPPDATPPAAVTDLAMINITRTSMNLTWTAPGDDGMNGTALSYDLRYSRVDIDQNGWNNATRVNQVPTPRPAGTGQWCLVSGLVANTTYYFAIRTKDHNNNTAAVSNVVSGTTLRIIPDLFIGPADISFSPEQPTEGGAVAISAAFHAVNLTHLIDLTVQLLVDDNSTDNRTVQFNASIGMAVFGWTAVRGNHSIGILLDPGGIVEETDRSNDLAERNISVAAIPPPPLPNLAILPSDISFSNETPVEGGTVNITAGFRAANITHELGIGLEMLVDGAVAVQKVVVLNGTSASFGSGWTAVRGLHDITILLDPGGLLAESDELDNSATRSIFVGAPDLFILPSDILIPVKSPLEGTVLSVTATVHAVNFTGAVAVRVDLLVDGNSTDHTTLPLDGPSGAIRFNWTAVAGGHDLTVVVDPANAILEQFEDNNRATVQILVRARPAAPVLDLFIGPSDISFSRPRPVGGQNITIAATVHAANITKGLTVSLDLRVDGIQAGSRTAWLEAGSPDATVQFPWTAAAGAHNISVEVNALDGVSESDTTNNHAVKELVVGEKPGAERAQDLSWMYAAAAAIVAVAVLIAVAAHRRNRSRNS